MRKVPMWSLCSTLKYDGHTRAEGGAGGPDARAIRKPRLAEVPCVNVAVATFSTQPPESLPSKSSKNCRKSSDASAQVSAAESSRVIVYGPGARFSDPMLS